MVRLPQCDDGAARAVEERAAFFTRFQLDGRAKRHRTQDGHGTTSPFGHHALHVVDPGGHQHHLRKHLRQLEQAGLERLGLVAMAARAFRKITMESPLSSARTNRGQRVGFGQCGAQFFGRGCAGALRAMGLGHLRRPCLRRSVGWCPSGLGRHRRCRPRRRGLAVHIHGVEHGRGDPLPERRLGPVVLGGNGPRDAAQLFEQRRRDQAPCRHGSPGGWQSRYAARPWADSHTSRPGSR